MGLFDSSNIDWGSLLGAGLNYAASKSNANSNVGVANNYAQQTAFNPYNIATGNSMVGFNGNNAVASLSPQYQAIQQQLMGGATGLLGGVPGMAQNGGINPYLQSSMNQYDQSAPQGNLGGINPYTQNMGNQFNQASQGFLGSLGNFDPTQAASDYTNNLRSQAQPQNQRAAESMAQNLFNTGRLGSTGGANLFGGLAQAQNQQDLQFQQAGRDYSGQEQNRLAGLAQGFGQQGDALNGSGFNRSLALNSAMFDQGNQRAQQRFQNSMSLFGAGQQNFGNQLTAGLGLLQGSQGLDQNLLNAIQMGGYLGGAQSSANQAAYAPSMEAGVAKNNTNLAGLTGLVGSSGILDQAGSWLGGLFGGSSMGNIGSGKAANDAVFNDPNLRVGLPKAPGGSNPNSAGGEAATSNGLLSAGNIGSGLDVLTGIAQGGVQGYGKAVAGGSSIANSAGLLGDTSSNVLGAIGNGASGNYAGAAKNIAGLLGSTAIPGEAALASGALANGALAEAGFGGASSGAAAASTGAASGGGALAASGLSTAMPLAAIGWAVADAFNKGGDRDSNAVSSLETSLNKQAGWQLVGVKNRMWKMPDGRLIQFGNEAKTFARTLMNKASPEETNKAWDAWMATAKGG